LQRKYGTQAWLHPLVAEPLHHADKMIVPWLPVEPIRADALWQTRGTWKWNEYRIKVAPWSGQTRWHCVFMTTIDGNRVAFGGDSFQPSSRWNGTGGFCAYNDSRFKEGFARSAELLRMWEPDIVACGHGTYYNYRKAKFMKIERWAQQTERAVRALCPSGRLQTDYYLETDGGRGQPNQFGAYYWINAIH
jgi:glyoxylase-like metal-dependent hydrolase (beta-lactamase superfamily II)